MLNRSLVTATLMAALLGAGYMIVVNMPGRSHSGTLEPLSAEQVALRDRLHTHVYTLAGTIGERNLYVYPALEAAAEYIEQDWMVSGYEPSHQLFQVQNREVRNLEVEELPGAARPDEVIVVGAHYDSVKGSPGANDNATGVAALLELARALRARTMIRTVCFVAFVNEEPPFSYTDAMGSKRYAQRAAAQGERIVTMLSLETIGYFDGERGSQRYPFPFSYFYPDTGNFLGFVGNLHSRALVRQAVGSFRRNARFPSEGVAAPGWLTGIGWSDHWAFWQVGYPAIMVTDTALFRYREYHTNADRPNVVDYDRFARVVDSLVAVVADLAGVPAR